MWYSSCQNLKDFERFWAFRSEVTWELEVPKPVGLVLNPESRISPFPVEDIPIGRLCGWLQHVTRSNIPHLKHLDLSECERRNILTCKLDIFQS